MKIPTMNSRAIRLLLVALLCVLFNRVNSQNSNLFKADVPDGFRVGIKMKFLDYPQPETSKLYEGQGRLQFVSFYLMAFDPKTAVADKDKRLNIWNNSTEKSDTYSLSNTKSSPVQIGFWGCSLLQDYTPELTARKSVKSDYLVGDLIADVMNEKGNLLIETNSNHEYKLLVFDLFTQPEAKNTFKDIVGTLHSAQVYLVWDKTSSPTLPSAIREAKYVSFPLNLKEPGPASLFFESSANWNNINFNQVLIKGSGSSQKVPSGKQLLLDKAKYSKISITKPLGYNIIIKGMPDTLNWKNQLFEYSIAGRSGEDTLQVVPLTYSIVYIDPTRSNQMAINQSIDTIIYNNPGMYYVYLAWKDRPVIANDIQSLNLLKGKILDLSFATANYEFDRNKILRNLETHIKPVSERMKVHLHLYLPWENASEITEKFINGITEISKKDKKILKCDLYIFGSSPHELGSTAIPIQNIHILKEK